MDASTLKTRIDARRKKLAADAPDDAPTPDSDLTPLHDRAAVLTSFTPDQMLRLAGPSTSDFYRVLADSRRTCSSGAMTLEDGVRREALARIGSREQLLDTLASVPERPDTPAQRMFEAYVRGTAPEPLAQTERELAATLTVAPWLRDVLDDIPEPDAVQRALDRTHLLQPFEWLAGNHFRGRQEELNRLRDYVGVYEASTYVEAASRVVRGVFSLEESPPLAIYGPGGVGKSTLLARFILDHAALDLGEQIPFIYIDFDRPHIRPSQPATLLLEGVRQLGIQFPVGKTHADRVHADWYGAIDGDTHVYPSFIEGLVSLLHALDLAERPLLLVLDTFEEVQGLGETVVRDVGQFLATLQQAWPRLRTVVSGRAPVRAFAFDTRDLPLGDLDADAARGFLRARDLDEQRARQIAQHFGGNPLTLRLAADLWHRATDPNATDPNATDPTAGVATRRYFLVRVTAEHVQGQLFRRILHHIHDDDVRRLAHPGLVLRRVTPPLIRHVLAGPCDVSVETDARAEELFHRLAREVSLVEMRSDDDVLYHRPDVRRVMLRLLEVDRPDDVRAIHEAAIWYYETHGERAEERAEEIYHRLALAQPHVRIEARWMNGVDPFLRGALADLDVVERAFLASKLGIGVTDAEREAADLQSWERLTATRVETEIASPSADLEAALATLREREARSANSPLYLLEIQVLEQMGRLDEAADAAAHARSALEGAEDAVLIFEVLTAQARLAWRMVEDDRARRFTREALDVARMTGDDRLQLRALVASLVSDGGLSSTASTASPPDAPTSGETDALDPRRAELAATVQRIPPDAILHHPDLLTDAAGMVGESNPAVLRLALRAVGLPDITTTDRRTLARAIHAETPPETPPKTPPNPPTEPDPRPDDDRPRSTIVLETSLGDALQTPDVSSKRISALLADLVGADSAPPGIQPVRSVVASIFRRAGRQRREALQDMLMPPAETPPAGMPAPPPPGPTPGQLSPEARAASREKGGAFTESFFDAWKERTRSDPEPAAPERFVVDRSRAQRLLQRQYAGLNEALERAVTATFTEDELAEVVRTRLRRSLYSTSLATDLDAITSGLFDTALQQEWAVDLILATLHTRPSSRPLQQFAQTHGLGLRHAPWTRSADDLFAGWAADDARFEQLGVLETHTCIVQAGSRQATGLLIGPDRVLTTPSVLHGTGGEEQIDVVFDRRWLRVGRESIGLEAGRRVGVQGRRWFQSIRWTEDAEATRYESVGIAELHLDRSVGDRPVGPSRNPRPGTKAAPSRQRDDAAPRGWMALDPSAPTPDDFAYALSFCDYRVAGHEFHGWLLEPRDVFSRRRVTPNEATTDGFCLLLDENMNWVGAAANAQGPAVSVPDLIETLEQAGGFS